MPHGRTIAKTLLTVTAPDGALLSAVTYAEGGCGIARDGQPLPEHHWELADMAQCTATLLKLAGLS
jgi:hypothetical protein